MKKVGRLILFCCSTKFIFSAVADQQQDHVALLRAELKTFRQKKLNVDWSREAYNNFTRSVPLSGFAANCKPMFDDLAQVIEEAIVIEQDKKSSPSAQEIEKKKKELLRGVMNHVSIRIHELWNAEFEQKFGAIMTMNEYYDVIKNCIKGCPVSIFIKRENSLALQEFLSFVTHSVHGLVDHHTKMIFCKKTKEKLLQEVAEKEKERQSTIKKLCAIRETKESQLQSSLNRTLNEFDLFAQEDCNLIINNMKRLKEMAAKIVVINGLIRDLLIDQDNQRELMMIDQGRQRESMMVDQGRQRELHKIRVANARFALVRQKTLGQTYERQVKQIVESFLVKTQGLYKTFKQQQLSEQPVVMQNVIDRQQREITGYRRRQQENQVLQRSLFDQVATLQQQCIGPVEEAQLQQLYVDCPHCWTNLELKPCAYPCCPGGLAIVKVVSCQQQNNDDGALGQLSGRYVQGDTQRGLVPEEQPRNGENSTVLSTVRQVVPGINSFVNCKSNADGAYVFGAR